MLAYWLCSLEVHNSPPNNKSILKIIFNLFVEKTTWQKNCVEIFSPFPKLSSDPFQVDLYVLQKS